ncbi:H/ACA ribonucleoprotein complex non-core subunit NAF1 isoform X1 [Diorhabda sublineata]|uniref:H/ACA ribonucleoprotein complex non-core subunit NAF1 isoform X1 n=1 Tax=Diorhabda sublineata TaxID=1163346 RepID=UPI0024E04CF8|nr:H/ACA ribonucleoprotein complex non-core subunit NAF1 isoform X1 [Diorhabda sublineata]XP_056641649.1 H/ACA ribonucleoprotein complex non-core subunit NAF1 isoform X1 [Diorhabda sublineata]
MDSHNSEQKIGDNSDCNGFVINEIASKSCEVTIEGIVQNEKCEDKEATSNSSCDNNSSNVKQVFNSDEGCDTKVNIDLTKENSVGEETERCTATIDNYITPVNENLKDILIQKVMNQVKDMNIIETPKNKGDSSVIIKNESSSLKNLLLYHSDSSDEEENEEYVDSWKRQIFPSDSSSSSVSESESQECVEISEDDEDDIGFVLPNCTNVFKKITDNDMDVPPPVDISNLQIDYEKEQFLHIGHISNFVNATVTVDTIENVASYDIDTVLFIDDKTSKKPFGGISDVIGPVCRPVYCVQLRDTKEIEQSGLEKGMKVYSAPKSPYAKYVFLKDLLKMKGSDASGKDDIEVPSDEVSTDEENDVEELRPQKRKHNRSLDRHKKFEKSKNESNIIKSRIANMMDRYGNCQDNVCFPHGFDPAVPPPVIQYDRAQPRFFTPPYNFSQAMPNRWFTPPMPNIRRNIPPRHHRHYNSPGPSNYF